MATQLYTTGTVTVLDGEDVVTGIGGVIWSGANVKPGDMLYIENQFPGIDIYEVTDIEHLKLPVNWSGGDRINVPYTIVQNFPSRVAGVEAAKDVVILVAALNKEGFYWFVGPDEDGPDPSRGDEGQYARKPSTGEEWLKEGGLWISQGISGPLTVTDTPWSSLTTYAARTVVPFMGKLWRSLQPINLNHQPDISPEWWAIFLSGGDAYDIASFDTDRPASGEDVLEFVFTKNVTFNSGMVDSRARAKVGATAVAVYSFRRNGVEFATLTFAAGGQGGAQVATFSCPATTVFVPGDYLSIIAPASRDATLSGIAWTISAYRN